jgi:beta-N-acetylhexosaminidase
VSQRRWPRLPGALLAALCVACGGQGSTPPRASPTPAVAPSASGGAAPSCAERVLAGMSEEQRVGQLFLLGLAGDRLGPAELDAIRVHHVGSVWFTERSGAGVRAVRAVADAVQAQATAQATAGVRFYVAANQEGGQVQALSGPGFSRIPAAVVQGGLAPGELERQAAAWGRELRAAGVNMDFAPVLDVVPPGMDASNEPIGVLQREYGHDAATAGSHGAAFLRGMRGGGVTTTIKHFPGLGRVQGNTDFTASVVDGATGPADASLQSFRQGIDAGAPFAMVALATYTRIDRDHLAVFSPTVMRQLLRDTLGFQGVVVSDDMGAAVAVAGVPPATRALAFLSAGGDLVISKTASVAATMAQAVVAMAAGDAAFRARVDDAAARVLRAKQAAGLLPC